MAHLLIVDDEESICWGLARLAESLGHTAAMAASAEQGLDSARTRRPDAIVLDVRLPGIDGLTAMHQFRDLLGTVPMIVITAYGAMATAVQAVRNGAFDYLVKPFELAAAQQAITRALRIEPAESVQPATLRAAEEDIAIIGASPAMQEIFKQIAVVAPSEACVHLAGESGTGKELVARALHRYSRRAAGPFVAVNMAALSPSLAESELFGHVRGAFTGAEQGRAGLLEQAHGGTLFLDEVAEVPLTLQVKLLRVLEHGEIMPVGGNQAVASDFRVISATHQDLLGRVQAGAFRHDLYYRLVTFEIDLPPLRERRGDIAELANHFLDRFAARCESPRPALSQEATDELRARSWAGNVRELRNAVEHAMILARGGAILPEHLPASTASEAGFCLRDEDEIARLVRRWAELQIQEAPDAGDLYQRLLRLVEPPLLEAAIQQYGGQCATAARQLGLHRTTLRRKLDQIRREED